MLDPDNGAMRIGSKIALGLVLLPSLALAATWWNNDWKFRKEIGFDLSPAGADIAGTPIDVPV
jgi:hypothetical protein